MVSSSTSHITLLATTRGRKEPVIRLLDSLCLQSYKNFTLLLGDQSSDGSFDDLLALYAGKINIERIPLEPQGLSKARNALLPYVKGDIVALTDDDCHYAPDCLEQVAHLFNSHGEMVGLIGNCNGRSKIYPKERQENRFSVFQEAPSWALFFRADAMRITGDFDEGLGIGSNGPYQSGEETDYLLRVLKANIGKILRSSSVHVFHDTFNFNDPSLLSKAYGYGVGRMHLLHKHKMPLWFRLANLIYPIVRALLEGGKTWPYRKAMFKGRLKGDF